MSRRERQGRRRLEAADVASVVGILTVWPEAERVTWEAIAKRVGQVAGHCWTRQTLEANPEIKAAYLRRRGGGTAGARAKPRDPADVLQRRLVEALRAEIGTLKQTVVAYEERFVLHNYNSRKRGITAAELAQPLPEIDRRRTDVERKVRPAKGG